MKCIKNQSTSEIRRVSDEKAREMVSPPKDPKLAAVWQDFGWKYTSKGSWRSAGRPR